MSILSEINPDVRRIKISEHDILEERADELRTEIGQGLVKRYKDVIDVSSGNPHGMGLKPLTFVRQVLATCFYPSLIHDESLPLDVRQRAQRLLAECDGGSIGSYPATYGIKHIRHKVSAFITRRDGVASNPDNIIITNGSQHALALILKLLFQGEGLQQIGVLTPVPCYRIFNKALVAQGAVSVPYYLCEDQGWTVQVEELRRALHAARGHCNPMVLYLINPGNPSGHVQSKASIEEVIRFAAEERLFIMADEVYQSCVFGKESEFYSYKKVLSEMGPPYSTNVELTSFHSISKGFMGECGLRCGYVEMVNFDPLVMHYACKAFTINALASVPGQITLDTMIDPPQLGDPSYAVYAQEMQSIMSAIKNNAQRIMDVVSGVPGMTCQPIKGGIFVFLRLHLSKAAIEHAKEKELEPDVLYSLRLLEDTGLCVATGSELRQKPGTHHIRICLATPEETMEDVLHRLKSFHLRFIKEFP